MLIHRSCLYLVCLLVFFTSSKAQKTNPPYLQYMYHPWVDSVCQSLSVDQKIAQCIWIPSWSNNDTIQQAKTIETIKRYGIGGIIFFQGSPEKQAELIRHYQEITNVPLITAMDAEWGVGMRLSDTEEFPYQLTLGAIRNDSLIYRFGKAVAEQCRRSGIDVNLAPVADINNNPLNPVINYRSFGENRDNVTEKASLYMKAMADYGIMGTIKHFPGHGDTDTDSHSDLPVIRHSRERLDSVELYPFRKLINEGAGIIMTAHLDLPALDTVNHLPASLSPLIIQRLLKEQLGYRGLVISDAMNMKGVTKYYKPGEAEAMAFRAGNDIIEYIPDIEAAIREINNDISLKRITTDEIDQKCRKILALKYWSLQHKSSPADVKSIRKDLNSPEIKALIHELFANALTLLNNKQNIIPVRNTDKLQIATLAVNKSGITSFQKRIASYITADHYNINVSDPGRSAALLDSLRSYDLIIAGAYDLDQRPNRQFGISPELKKFIDTLNSGHKCIISWFGNPYSLDKIHSLEETEGLVLAYQENEYTEDLAAQLIFGAIGARGSLPVTINSKWQYNYGIITPGGLRVQYGFPENAGMSSFLITKKTDSLICNALKLNAFPGCEIMVARKGIVIFHKTYGFHSYDSVHEVKKDDLFDLASITKIAATLPGLMLLDTEGKFSPDEKLSTYLPEFRRSDKGDLKMTEILTHQSGFMSWIPFWKMTVKKNGQLKKRFFNSGYSDKYPLTVAHGLYIKETFTKKIRKEIRKSPLGEKKYLYSDLGFILIPEIIGNLSGEEWYDYISSGVYQKIGAENIVFNPYLKYPPERIIPTEYDSLFRQQLLHGTVHDEGAAMLGGISGHAGLFSTANDLMKLMEMYRMMGAYCGEQIIGRKVMERYTKVQFPENDNRRGLGFDKPVFNNSEVPPEESNTARSASPSSFGHTGYTGTYVWIDPEYEMSFIFLSNRVFPTRDNNLITKLNLRSNLLQTFYDSIIE